MSRYLGIAVILVVSAAAAPQAAAADKIKLAVLDLRDKGVDPDLAGNLTDIVIASLGELGVFQTISRADIQRMLELEETKQALGCDEISCLAEIGGALGVGLLVSGSIGKVGNSYIINLSLTDTATVTVTSREQRQVSTADALPEAVRGATRFLVRELLEGRQGELIVATSERDAEVEIDGRIIGMTPIGRQTLAGGPHRIKLHKKGFVSWARDIEISSDQPVVIDAAMVPSYEFIAEYDRSAFRWRLAAYVTGGVGLALLAYGIGGYIWNGDEAARYERNLTKNNCQENPPGPALIDCSGFAQRQATIESFDQWMVAAMITGTVLTSAGAVLFLYGPEVGAYDQYKGVSIGLAPLPDGGLALGTFRF